MPGDQTEDQAATRASRAARQTLRRGGAVRRIGRAAGENTARQAASDDPHRLNEEELKRLGKDRLLRIARDENLPNRSKMNKAQLARTLRRHFRASPS
jgi:hypothetical protein